MDYGYGLWLWMASEVDKGDSDEEGTNGRRDVRHKMDSFANAIGRHEVQKGKNCKKNSKNDMQDQEKKGRPACWVSRTKYSLFSNYCFG